MDVPAIPVGRRSARAARVLLCVCSVTGWSACRSAPRDGGVAPPAETGAAAPRAPETDLTAHLARLREQVPDGFTIVPEPPFVVLAEGTAAAAAEDVEIVRWTVRMLRGRLFDHDIDGFIDVWLFRDAVSYERGVRTIFHEATFTPYGYYSPDRRALVMNIATGGGTLVHELVHPMLHADFPAAPTWLNEGIASLYEQSIERQGHIAGLPNWRLPGLQRAIRRGSLPPLQRLLAWSKAEFDAGGGTAQARYLCYWLQEHGLLVAFYRAFRERHATDPTGVETLRTVLGEPDLAAFQRRWEQFVLGLSYPES